MGTADQIAGHLIDNLTADRISVMKDSVSSIKEKTDRIELTMNSLDRKVNSMGEEIETIHKELKYLTEEFNKMVEDQRKTANLQRAISELIRVRQEIDQKYGNYTVIRQTMIGVLQATDSALVKKTTISTVSEELMISTPNYWLAPCLVAVAAWISNNKELAERAIAEAMRRDEEKTALAMALICRRNGRVQTGYEWLSIYFAKQSAMNFTEESFVYIDAYVNGIFGPDTRHTCQGYVSKWIDEVRGNKSNFEESQVKMWRDYCKRYSKNTDEEYPDLASSVPEYGKISTVIGRIEGVADIKKDFQGMKEAFVDQDALRRAVDAELIHLISNYDVSELDIRKEEEYLSLVKYFAGDEDKAREEMQAREAKRLKHKLDFIEQMSSEITSGKETTPSKKKTAVTFLGTYINKGINHYISEPKAEFPKEVTLNVDRWSGKSREGNELAQLSSEFETAMNESRRNAITFAINTKPRLLVIASIVFAILAMITGVTSYRANPASWITLPAALLAIAVICLLYRFKINNDVQKAIAKVNEDYDNRIREGKVKIERILNQWNTAKQFVENFDETTETKIVA